MFGQFGIVVKSQTDPTKAYEVKFGHDGVLYCTCPAWKYQHGPAQDRTCKHMKAVKQELASK